MTPMARLTDPATSHEAALSVTNLSSTYSNVLFVLKRLGNATDEELWWMYQEYRKLPYQFPPVSPSGLRSRRSELVSMGLVQDTKRTRRTMSGRRAIVWAPNMRQEQT